MAYLICRVEIAHDELSPSGQQVSRSPPTSTAFPETRLIPLSQVGQYVGCRAPAISVGRAGTLGG